MDQALDDRIQAPIGPTPFESGYLSRKLTQQIATENLERLKSHALDLVQDSVVAVDPAGCITYLNHAAECLYGWKSLELAGRAIKAVLFADRKAFDAAWLSLQENGEWRGEIAQRTKQGTELILQSHWSAVREKYSPTIQSILIVTTDASQLNLTAAGFAHEVRNPLAGIKGVADALLQRGQLSCQEREWMEAVRREVLKIDARMRELLDVSQPRVFSIKQCLLGELVNGVVMLARHHATSVSERDGRQISVQFIDATTEPLIMHLDPARIEDAVLNLVLNAIESIEQDGLVTVYLRRRSTNAGNDGEALIEVIDTGRGVSAEIRDRIFEPRFTTKREGTGLGLAAVKRTAAAYHGRISFRTRSGRGSKFVLALPLGSQHNLTENSK